MKELKFKNKTAAAFGCYGWSGESVGVINEKMADAGFAVIDQGLKNMWNPDVDAAKKAFEYGKAIARA
jgi:flavorubredoxin